LAAAVSAALISESLVAAPFSGTITESGGNITFRLPESADEVIVLRDGVPTSLGALASGSHTFARNGATNYSILARKASGDGYITDLGLNTAAVLQLSDDNSVFNQFERGVGMAVNNNPATPNLFGRMYVSCPSDTGTASGRLMTKGVYILNPDHTESIAGQGATGFTGGIAFDPGLSSPFRIALDDAGNVYMGDWSDPTGSVYRTGPDVGNVGGANAFVGTGGTAPIAPTSSLNHGSNAALAVTGSPGAGNLTIYVIDEDLSTTGNLTELNSLWRFDMGSTTASFSGIPTRLSGHLLDFTEGIVADLQRSGDGKFYMSQNRSAGTEAGVYVVASDGVTTLYDSLTDTTSHGIDVVDVLRQTRNIAVSPDGRFLAAGTTQAGDVIVVPVLAGIPDLSNRLLLDAFTGTSNDAVGFDAAGNVTVVNRSDELLRTFSPGGLSVTAFNSNGTFSMDPSYTAGAGNYSTAGSWLMGVVPNGANHVARFAGTGGAVNLASATTLGAIKFDSASSYTLSGSAITLQGASPNVISQQGSHTISAPLVLTQSTGLVARGGTLTIADLSVTGSPARPVEVFTGGDGVVAVNKVVAESLYVVEGTTRITANGTSAATSRVKSLRIAGGATPIAKLDLTNNAMVVDYSPPAAGVAAEPFDTIQAQIASAYSGGAWTGNGITSSNANANNFAVGYAEASALTSIPAIFGSVDADTVLIRGTRFGDADLNGQVNSDDFNRLASSFGTTGNVWSSGNFNYDVAGEVNSDDFNLLATNFGLSATGPDGSVTPQDWANLAAAVPEPSTGLLLAGLATSVASRRRRR